MSIDRASSDNVLTSLIPEFERSLAHLVFAQRIWLNECSSLRFSRENPTCHDEDQTEKKVFRTHRPPLHSNHRSRKYRCVRCWTFKNFNVLASHRARPSQEDHRVDKPVLRRLRCSESTDWSLSRLELTVNRAQQGGSTSWSRGGCDLLLHRLLDLHSVPF